MIIINPRSHFSEIKAKPKELRNNSLKHTSVFLCVTVILLDLQPSTRKANSAPICTGIEKDCIPSNLEQLKNQQKMYIITITNKL